MCARTLQFVAVAALVACFLPGIAVGRRLATGSKKAAVIAALRSAGQLGTPQKSSCLRVYISTVNANWATVQFVYSPRCERLDGNGVAVLHFGHGKWRFVIDGSAIYCPIPGHIPKRVQADLKLFCVPR